LDVPGSIPGPGAKESIMATEKKDLDYFRSIADALLGLQEAKEQLAERLKNITQPDMLRDTIAHGLMDAYQMGCEDTAKEQTTKE
jgi:hypothetical protein